MQSFAEIVEGKVFLGPGFVAVDQPEELKKVHDGFSLTVVSGNCLDQSLCVETNLVFHRLLRMPPLTRSVGGHGAVLWCPD